MLNVPPRWNTFKDSRGRGSNVELMVVTRDMGNRAWEWKLIDVTLSDHRILSFTDGVVVSREWARLNEIDERKWSFK